MSNLIVTLTFALMLLPQSQSCLQPKPRRSKASPRGYSVPRDADFIIDRQTWNITVHLLTTYVKATHGENPCKEFFSIRTAGIRKPGPGPVANMRGTIAGLWPTSMQEGVYLGFHLIFSAALHPNSDPAPLDRS